MEREAGVRRTKQTVPDTREDDTDEERRPSITMAFPQAKPKRSKDLPSARTRKAEAEARKKTPKAAISKKWFRGTSVYGQITGDKNVPLDHVSLGSEVVRELLDLPNSGFLDYATKQTGLEITGDALSQVIDAVNNANIPVGIFKSPNLEPESACQVYLMIHEGRDIRIHPLAAKKFNADFDGDAVTISFKEKVIKRLADAGRFLINLAGDLAIDLDFFPRYMVRGGIVNPAHRENVIQQAMNGTFDFIESGHVRRNLAEKMADVYFENSKEAMRAFVQALANVATNERGRLDTRIMSDAITRMYDDLKALQMMQAAEGQEHFILDELPKPVSLEDRRLYDFTESLLDEVTVKAKGAMNFQDLRVMFCDYLGEPRGTNPSFRFTANVAKMFVNIDSHVQIGSDVEVGLEEMLDGVLRFVESRKISNALALSESAKSAKELMREIILTSVGFPSGYNTFGEFVTRFVEVYRRNEAIINGANIEIMTDMSMGRNRGETNVKGIGVNPDAASVARVLLDVYGDYRMSFIFDKIHFEKDLARIKHNGSERERWNSGRFVNIVYGSMTLREFSQENKLNLRQGEFENASRVSLFGRGGVVSDDFDVNLLLTIADMRSSGSSNFNVTMFGRDSNVDNSVMFKLLQTLRSIDYQLKRSSASLDWSTWISDMVDLVNDMNPNVYAHFGMDSARGFFESDYGRAMLDTMRSNASDHQKVQRLGSIYLAMVAEYRMARVKAQSDKLAAVEESPNYSVQELIALTDAQHAAESMLASSSAVWRTVVKELRSNKSERYFDRLKAGENPMGLTMNFKGWTNGRLAAYETIYDVMLDINLTKDEKCDIISDVVRCSEGFAYFNSFEVPAQLERDQASVYSVLPPSSVGIMETVNEFNESFDKFAKRSWREMQKQVDDAYDQFGNQPGRLAYALGFFAENPECFIEMDEMSFADALCSVLDKTYDQSEKSKQHPWTNAFYSMMCQIRNFGFFSDVYRTDDRALGLVAIDQLSAYDIIALLSDGDKVMHVYNSRGEIIYLTRDALIGVENATEEDIWQFLKDNPRIASCLRMHRSCVTSDGKGFIGAVSSIAEFIESSIAEKWHGETIEERQIRYRLYDHPSYAALVGICVPTGGKLSRSMRGAYHEVDRALRKEIAYLALHEDANPQILLGKLRLTVDDIEKAGATHEAAMELSSLIQQSLTSLSSAISDLVTEASTSSYEFKAPDLQACFSYYDIRQELTGSKTAVSTGVEGSETWKLAAFISALQPEDRYADLLSLSDIADVDNAALIEKFGDCMTQFGVTVSQLDDEMWNNGEIVIEAPEGFTVPDKTLDSYGRQVSSACAYLIVKRDAGAEKFNLKAKKTGDDKLDSVTKHGKYFTDEELSKFDFQTDNYNDLLDRINSIYDENDPSSLFQAKLVIAQHLQTANELCGYEEMTLANCMSLADLMVVPGDDGSLRLRSIEMIAKAIKSHIDYDIIEHGSAADFHALAQQAAMEAGRESFEVADIIASIRPATKVFGRTSIVRPRSSSWETNYSILNEIVEKTGHAPISQEEAKTRSDQFAKRFGDYESMLARSANFSMLGKNESRIQSPGANTLWLLDTYDDTIVADLLRDAWKHGVSVMVPNDILANTTSGRKVAKNAVPFPGDELGEYALIPFFDVRLNGFEASNTPPVFGVFRRPADNIVWSYEDSLNEFSLGDAGIQFFKSLVDRIKIKWSDTTTIQSGNLFANIYAEYPDAEFRVSKASLDDLRIIARGDATIDVGVAPEGRGFEQHYQMTMNAVDRYIDELPSFAEHGGFRQDANPGDVIGFAKIEILPKNSTQRLFAYAPIILFDLQGTNGVSREAVPSKFHIDSISPESDMTPMENVFLINWTYIDDPTGHVFKFFEGQGNANKFLASANQAIEGGTFRNGVKIDAAYAPESTASRRIGTNKRIGTLQTLMFMARTEGYNFAEQEDSFPDNPDIKDELREGYVSRNRWNQLIDDDFRWHRDDKVNSFVKHEVAKFIQNGGNPTDYLCSKFGDSFTDIWWEFECMFEPSRTYQDCLMAFLHSMNENLCADSIDDSSEGYLFRCMPSDKNDPFSTHCMAMQVPHVDPQGGYFYRWENVYAGWSFLNFNDFSGAHRINVNGASDMLDAVATLALSGRTPDIETYRAWLRSSLSDVGEMKSQSSIISLNARDPFTKHGDMDDSQEQ